MARKRGGLSRQSQVGETQPRRPDFRNSLSSPNYERLRARLIRIFACRGCHSPEDLADETIARVALKLDELARDYEGDPARYFVAVARNVYLEYTREPKWTELERDPNVPSSRSDRNLENTSAECLEVCLSKLDREDRSVVTEYYRYEKSAQIEHRKMLAEAYGMGLNAFRIRVHRIRGRLARCVAKCMEGRK